MCRRHANGSDSYHSSVKIQGFSLVVLKLTAPSAGHFGNTAKCISKLYSHATLIHNIPVNGPNEDGQEREAHCTHEKLPTCRERGRCLVHSLVCLIAVAIDPQPEVNTKAGAQEHGSNLNTDASQHDIVSYIYRVFLATRSKASTSSLGDDTEDIAADEYPNVEVGLDFRIFRSVV